MGRDLLYKPPVPVVPQEDEGTKPGAKPGAKPQTRELGSVGKTFEVPAGYTPPAKDAAYKAAYFNKDVSGVGQVNLNQSGAQALRGAEAAVDLRKVVLPPPAHSGSPDPERLRMASALMGLDGSIELSFEALMGRQSGWARAKEASAEAIRARILLLEQMVMDRHHALARLRAAAAAAATAISVTVHQAMHPRGNALEDGTDVVTEGRLLSERTAGQAEGMHQRIAKMLGLKRAAK